MVSKFFLSKIWPFANYIIIEWLFKIFTCHNLYMIKNELYGLCLQD